MSISGHSVGAIPQNYNRDKQQDSVSKGAMIFAGLGAAKATAIAYGGQQLWKYKPNECDRFTKSATAKIKDPGMKKIIDTRVSEFRTAASTGKVSMPLLGKAAAFSALGSAATYLLYRACKHFSSDKDENKQ